MTAGELRARTVEALVRGVLRPIAAGGRLSRGPLPSGRRLLLLHLDGVGRAQLRLALRRGYLPTVARLLQSGRYRVSGCRAGAPTSTPAFQAGLLYGVQADIPGYVWFDKRRRRPVRMDSGDDARELEAQLAQRGRPLLSGGSVYCSIFSGGARPSRWALTGIGERLGLHDLAADPNRDPVELPGARDLLASALVHSATAGNILASLGVDAGQGLYETARWARRIGSLQHEPRFYWNRLLTQCLFPEFAANATLIDVARGTPIVYACFIGYDEYAHRRGPDSRTALLKLWELDHALGRIFAAVQAVPELRYEIYLFSDHGQARTRPAEQILGESLAEYLLCDAPLPVSLGRTAHGAPAPLYQAYGGAGGGRAAAEAQRVRRLRQLASALPGAFSSAALGYARHAARALDGAQREGVRAEGPLLVVPAGDVAHVYSTQAPEPLREGELRARHPGLLDRCAACPAVGLSLVRGDRPGSALAFARGRRLHLSHAADAADLARLVGHPLAPRYCQDLLDCRSAGDVLLVGAGAPGGDTVAYPWEFGSHGGIAREEIETFLVHPAELGHEPFAGVERPVELHAFFEERAGRAPRLAAVAR
jgi:hypothetical protein